jgi:putative radical SAM enzyme (TIGR03279 family)
MKSEIIKVSQGSLAQELSIEPGDFLISINGEPVNDIIDYMYLIADENIIIEIEKTDGEIWKIEVDKDYDEKLGVEFKLAIMDKPKSCHNNCIFCFIDQMPKGLRETLYFKDDDSRLAFLQGNFVTLTNMSDADIDRIIKYKISPINVSVHTTNPQLRILLTNNKNAGNIYARLEKLATAGIIINCQIVLCPGLNDGEEFIKTVNDLYKLYPQIGNIAAVPVGITKFREGLYPLKSYNKVSAQKEINNILSLQKKFKDEIGSSFIRLSDEFYILANIAIPSTEFYDDFKQLEDGIGVVRAFRNAVESSINKLNHDISGSFTIITGTLAYNEIKKVVNKIMSINPDIKIVVNKINNTFFGETITVSGLITAYDIINQCDKESSPLIIPSNMLRKGYELFDDVKKIFLDDITVEELEKKLRRKILICDFTGEDLIDTINTHCRRKNHD